MNDITALAQRLRVYAEEFSYPVLSPDDCRSLVEALESGDTENERMARDLMSRNGEIEGLRKRVEDLEEIATDYGMKFQRAQDDLKKMALMESRTVTVKLPKRSVGEVMHMSGFDRQYAEGWCSGNDNAINEMKLAGIQVIEGGE